MSHDDAIAACTPLAPPLPAPSQVTPEMSPAGSLLGSVALPHPRRLCPLLEIPPAAHGHALALLCWRLRRWHGRCCHSAGATSRASPNRRYSVASCRPCNRTISSGLRPLCGGSGTFVTRHATPDNNSARPNRSETLPASQRGGLEAKESNSSPLRDGLTIARDVRAPFSRFG